MVRIMPPSVILGQRDNHVEILARGAHTAWAISAEVPSVFNPIDFVRGSGRRTKIR
jgi:hypothetical protein